jgi:hypothetical protein
MPRLCSRRGVAPRWVCAPQNWLMAQLRKKLALAQQAKYLDYREIYWSG